MRVNMCECYWRVKIVVEVTLIESRTSDTGDSLAK
jgi:hypothetical protein